jgi:putative ABC transport system permease protein
MRIATLDRKLLRDLKRLKAQAIAVSAVLACGVALFVMATGMYGSNRSCVRAAGVVTG